MRCAWKSYLNLIPIRLRQQVDNHGYETLLELRLRCGQCPELVTTNGSVWLDTLVTKEDLHFTINVASQYSAWSLSTASEGYITAAGGHRIGLCGQAVVNQGVMTGIREPTSVNVRLAKEFSGIARQAVGAQGSTLIIGRPGSGKTTLLRDLICLKSQKHQVVVIDERQELFPRANGAFCFETGLKTDILSCCHKPYGVQIAMRSMNPDYIAIDEITADIDCESLVNAGWCGVSLLATAHAGSKNDLYSRPVYKPIIEMGLFDNLIVMGSNRTWHLERMEKC